MAEQTRNTRLALMVETTEGTPVVPAAGTDFIALQDGFTVSPDVAVLDNKEIKASIGKSKSITGIEQPKANMKHYLRHSGVEGQAPGFRKLLQAAFGTETVAATQYPTVSSSTVSDVKVNTGIGANFQRGQALLVKDGTNGYSIRPVLSVSGDDLTPGFNLPGSPASGINLGKAVMYSVLQSGHPTLTMWEYRANGGALEVMSGVRVTELDIDIAAGELINATYGMEGVHYYLDPINITATSKFLDFLDNATTRVATLTPQLFVDPVDCAQAIQDAMNSLGSSNTFTCTYDSTNGKFTITSNGSTLTLKWNTGANTANSIASKIGFSTAADSSAALTYSSPTAQSWAAAIVPSYDSSDPLAAKANEVLIGNASDTTSFQASKLSFKMSNSRSEIKSVVSTSGVNGSVISERKVSIDVSGILTRHDVTKFDRFKQNTDTSFLFNCGVKSGGNWVAGKCASIYLPLCSITKFNISDDNGLVIIEMTLEAFVDSSGNGEVYLNFV